MDCNSCPNQCPELNQDNLPAWELWATVQTQWRTDMGQLVGLDYNALYLVAESLNIRMTPGNLQRIKSLETAQIQSSRKKD